MFLKFNKVQILAFQTSQEIRVKIETGMLEHNPTIKEPLQIALERILRFNDLLKESIYLESQLFFCKIKIVVRIIWIFEEFRRKTTSMISQNHNINVFKNPTYHLF